ncbi:MAG: hypothetical protein KW793_04750 [Candidatus Doudnabacteria bacterium]|nr:hypothetical protein [Candidatus Doudnabacteria bacterium]
MKAITIKITPEQAQVFAKAHRQVSDLLFNEHAEDADYIDACENIIPNLHDASNPMLVQIKKQLRKNYKPAPHAPSTMSPELKEYLQELVESDIDSLKDEVYLGNPEDSTAPKKREDYLADLKQAIIYLTELKAL